MIRVGTLSYDMKPDLHTREIVFGDAEEVKSGEVKVDAKGVVHFSGDSKAVFSIRACPTPQAARRRYLFQVEPLHGELPYWVKSLFDNFTATKTIVGAGDLAASQWAYWYWNQYKLPARKLLGDLVAACADHLTVMKALRTDQLNGDENTPEMSRYLMTGNHDMHCVASRFFKQQERAWRRKVGEAALALFAERPLEGIVSLGEHYWADLPAWNGRRSRRFETFDERFSPYMSEELIKLYGMYWSNELYSWSRKQSAVVTSSNVDLERAPILSDNYVTAISGYAA